MKKLLPVFLTLIMIICSFSACEKTVNPIDRFDDVNSFTTLEKLKEKFPNGKIIEETENSFKVEDHDSLLQELAEKYGVTVTTEVEIKSVFNDGIEDIFVYIDLTSPSVTKDDMKIIMDQLTLKYGRFEDENPDDPKYCRYTLVKDFCVIGFRGYIGEGITVRYMFS